MHVLHQTIAFTLGISGKTHCSRPNSENISDHLKPIDQQALKDEFCQSCKFVVNRINETNIEK